MFTSSASQNLVNRDFTSLPMPPTDADLFVFSYLAYFNQFHLNQEEAPEGFKNKSIWADWQKLRTQGWKAGEAAINVRGGNDYNGISFKRPYQLVIASRGTVTLSDMKEDLNFILLQHHNTPQLETAIRFSNYIVRSQLQAMSLVTAQQEEPSGPEISDLRARVNSIRSWVKESLTPPASQPLLVMLAGHSLGGALAEMTLLDMLIAQSSGTYPNCTFSSLSIDSPGTREVMQKKLKLADQSIQEKIKTLFNQSITRYVAVPNLINRAGKAFDDVPHRMLHLGQHSSPTDTYTSLGHALRNVNSHALDALYKAFHMPHGILHLSRPLIHPEDVQKFWVAKTNAQADLLYRQEELITFLDQHDHLKQIIPARRLYPRIAENLKERVLEGNPAVFSYDEIYGRFITELTWEEFYQRCLTNTLDAPIAGTTKREDVMEASSREKEAPAPTVLEPEVLQRIVNKVVTSDPESFKDVPLIGVQVEPSLEISSSPITETPPTRLFLQIDGNVPFSSSSKTSLLTWSLGFSFICLIVYTTCTLIGVLPKGLSFGDSTSSLEFSIRLTTVLLGIGWIWSKTYHTIRRKLG